MFSKDETYSKNVLHRPTAEIWALAHTVAAKKKLSASAMLGRCHQEGRGGYVTGKVLISKKGVCIWENPSLLLQMTRKRNLWHGKSRVIQAS